MGSFVYSSPTLTEDDIIKGQYIHYSVGHVRWFDLTDKQEKFNNLMKRYIDKLNDTIKVTGPDGQKIKNLSELDDGILEELFDTMAVAANEAVQESFASERQALVNAQYLAQKNVKGILTAVKNGDTDTKALDKYLLGIQQALKVITTLNEDAWAHFIVDYKDYLKGGKVDILKYESQILSQKANEETKTIVSRILAILNKMPQYDSTKSIQTATTNITKGIVGEKATGIINSLKLNALDIVDSQLENIKGNSIKVLRQGKQQVVGSKQVDGGTGKVDLFSQGNKVQISINSSQRGKQSYVITGQLNSSAKWYEELRRTQYKTSRNIHIQYSSSFMNYAREIYGTDRELYGIYNSFVFQNTNTTAHKNIKMVKRNIVNAYLEQMLAGKGGKDLAAFMVINGRKIPILAILQEYIKDMKDKEGTDKSFVYVHTSYLEPSNIWEGDSSHNIAEAWNRSNKLHRLVDDLAMTVSLDRIKIYNLGQRYAGWT